ncbi:MAG: MobA protein [Bacteroidaceae bacterium]|nr:MobA protein [Bacteroidaceae bacterium]
MDNKKNKGGRNPKLDPATNRYSVNFSSEEDMRFLKMFDRSGMTSKSAFIKARIFGEPFHVVSFDKSQHEYYTKLSDFHAQFRMVGNNYNQTLKELKSHFSERRTAVLVYKLEKYMMQLVQIMHKVIELTDEYQKRIQKSENKEI